MSSRTDVYPERFATRLELVGDRHVVTEQAISWHFHADHSGQYRSGVQSNSHLKSRRLKTGLLNLTTIQHNLYNIIISRDVSYVYAFESGKH